MNSFKKFLMLAFVAALMLMAGCATDGAMYRNQNSQYSSQGEFFGVIYSVRPTTVQVENTTGLGLASGAIVGGLLGNKVGHGNGRKLATVLGMIGGGIAGNEIKRHNNLTNVPGVEMQIRADNGQVINLVQPDQGQRFRSGTRVRLNKNGNQLIASY